MSYIDIKAYFDRFGDYDAQTDAHNTLYKFLIVMRKLKIVEQCDVAVYMARLRYIREAKWKWM